MAKATAVVSWLIFSPTHIPTRPTSCAKIGQKFALPPYSAVLLTNQRPCIEFYNASANRSRGV